VAKRKIIDVVRETDPNAWMVTFSDLLTLLLTFFVLLLTMSSMDQKKIEEAFGDLLPQPGIIEGSGTMAMQQPSVIPVAQRDLSGTGDSHVRTEEEAYHELLRLLEVVAQNEDFITIENTEDGIVVRFRSDLGFYPNSDELLPGARQLLDQVAPLINTLAFGKRIEGHTAAVLDDNASAAGLMSLSLRRAHTVLTVLLACEEVPVSERDYSLVGRGAQDPRLTINGLPVSPTDPRQGRVEIIVQTRIRDISA